jgi:serine/threonine protein kinase
MAAERAGHILQTTALVNEAYLRLIDWKNVHWQNRAHFFGLAAQIMHRDIKPENIMLRSDRIVKVLDFGLAKLTLQQVAPVDTEAPTESMLKTDPGIVMGTAQYMSPEQARGLEVDARTDIWSLGVVLYEMVTGRAPFTGDTPSHVIVSILESEPPPLARYSEVPAELERIITKALRKDREERYQTPATWRLI